MTAYKGSNKTDEIYIGSTKIGKIYKGSTLVYESDNKLQIWGFDGNTYSIFVLGTYDTNGLVISNTNAGQPPATGVINNITGIIGQSGSKVNIYIDGEYRDYNYNSSISIDGKIIHAYTYILSSFITFIYCIYVLEDSVVGNYYIDQGNVFWNGFVHPASITENSLTVGNNTYTRNFSLDYTFTKENGLA